MGAARGHLDRLAAQPRGLARPLRAHPVGLRRDRAQARPRGAGAHPGAERRRSKPQARRILAKVGANLDAVEFFQRADRPRLDARLRPAVRQESPRAKSRSRRGASTPGPSTTTGSKDAAGPSVPRPSGSSCRCSLPEMVLEGGSIDVNGARPAADHRGMPAQPRAGAQSRNWAARRSNAACATTWASTRVIWLQQRHRRRRYARARGRPRALREPRDRGDAVRPTEPTTSRCARTTLLRPPD